MKAKKKTLFSSICAIVLCLSLIAGSTFALFTSESKVDISVTSGKVKVTATVDDMTLYSATTEDTGSLAGTIASGSHAGTYYYEEVSPTFTNSGTAEYADGTLTLDRVTPGDKVNFNVGITNESNVNIKYRVLVTVTSGLKLFNALKVKIDGTSLSGVSRTGAWTSLVANGSISDIPVEIYLPIEAGNEYQDLSTNLSITVEAVQGNAYTSDGALTTAVEAIAEEVTAVDPETKKTAEETTISDGDNLVTVTIPANTKLNAEDEASSTSLAVKVTPQDTVSNITVLSTQASASYDVSVLLVVDDVITEDKAVNNAENEEEITVKMFIGTGLTGVKLYHNTDEIEYDSYDSETGYLTFKTTSFSEYTVLYNKDFAYETFDEVTGESTGITVLEATETTGVYKSTDENEEEVFVKVAEDENGNVTATNMFAGGTGSQEDPFLVYDYATMQNISDFYDKGYYYFAVDMSKTDNGTIDCTGWVPVKLHGSFDGNGVQFNNVTACLFQTVGYKLLEEDVTLKDFDATMNVSSNGEYGAAALVKNIFSSGVTTFNNVNVHGYLEGFWNMGSFFNYGTANYDDVGCDYEVVFIDCSSDATLVCASGNTMGGLLGHAYEGANNSFTLRVTNSEYTGQMFLATSGKGNKYFAMTSHNGDNTNNHFYFDGVEETSINSKNYGTYTDSTQITKITAQKQENGYVISKAADASKIVATITAQLSAYDNNDVQIPNLSGITMTLASTEFDNLDGESIKVLDLFNGVSITLNADAYNAAITNGTLNVSIANNSNYKSGAIRLQVNQYDSDGVIVSAGTIDIATCANATSQWIIK